MMRPPLPGSVVERIRRERSAPRVTQYDFLHLRDLVIELRRTLDALPAADGPTLDLYCGARPYDDILPRQPVCALDIDRHFGRANVVGTIPLPFRDGAFSVVLCTQALYLVDDPVGTVAEMRRVTAAGGHAVVSVPVIFRREGTGDRRYTPAALQELFRAWRPVRITRVGGPASGAALYAGQAAAAAARHWSMLGPLLSGVAVALNVCAMVVDSILRPVAPRWSHSVIVVAQRPTD
jgi:SAM-dependent methyltransferase